MNEIKIDSEFRNLPPKLTSEELIGLENDLQKDGCLDPLILWQGILIDGHHRYDICTRLGITYKTTEIQLEDRLDAEIWILDHAMNRRNLPPFSRVELALKLKPRIAEKAMKRMLDGKVSDPAPMLAQGETRDQLADIAGVSHGTLNKVEFLLANADEKTKDELHTHKGPSINAVYKKIKETQEKATRRKNRKDAAESVPLHPDIIVGDFRKHSDKVADGSLSLIFTDPPYDRKAEEMLPGLAKFASDKLAEGGSLICYVGQTQLPAAIDAFRKYLRYWWIIACQHSGGTVLMKEYGIRPHWKPILWFVKNTRENKENIVIDLISGGKEKDQHEWQQAESEANYWIKNLCPEKDDLVCDPFCGSGTTLIAAEKLNRKWIAFEIDSDTAKLASKRVNE